VPGPTLEKFPTVGEATVITDLPEAAKTVRFTYQPDAPVSSTETLAVEGGSLTWTPQRPGIVKIEALGGDASAIAAVDRSVRFDGAPGSGVAIFLVAALVLFGGAAWSLRLLLRND